MKKLFYNGPILTMENETSIAEAVLIENDKILAVGAREELLAECDEDTEQIDLRGNAMLPGFIDSHSHFVMAAQMLSFADLTNCTSFEDIQSTLTQYMESDQGKKSDVIIGYGYDHNDLIPQKHPDKFVLDQVTTDKVVFILHISSHMGVLNSIGLQQCGITKQTQDMDGGRFGRVDDGMEPDGYLEEGAMYCIQTIMKNAMPIDYCKMLESAQQLYFSYGITTVQEGAASLETMQLLNMVAASKKLTIDIVAYPIISKNISHIPNIPVNAFDTKYYEHVRVGGYKLILDGSPQGKSAWLSQPYEGEKEYSGYPWLSDDEVIEGCKLAIKNGQQLLVHCNGDAASEQFLDCYEQAIKDLGDCEEDLRPVMIHCQTVRSDQIKRMKSLKMIASIFVGHVYYWGDVHLKNLGLIRGKRISPVATSQREGLVVTFHQDTPVTKPDMLHSVWCATKRQTKKDVLLEQGEAVSIYDGLCAVTKNAAYQYHEEDIKGTICEGKQADFVILSRNPLEVSVDELRDINIVETIKSGESVFRL